MKRIFLLICAALLLLSLSACRSRATAVEVSGAAEAPNAAQAGRTAAQVLLAKAMYPSFLSDTDADEALSALMAESGRTLSGTVIFVG